MPDPLEDFAHRAPGHRRPGARGLEAVPVMAHGLACAPGGAALASRLGLEGS